MDNYHKTLLREKTIIAYIQGAFCLMLFLAWVTHIGVTIYDESWLFLIAGAIFFPIAIFHGFWMWLVWAWNFLSWAVMGVAGVIF